jgi:hypothetical protein
MASARLRSRLTWLFPFLVWLPKVRPEDLRADLVAALTGAVIVLPQGVAFATIAGMPPEYGLYAGMVPAIIAALFGSSRHLVSGPTTAASVVLFSSVTLFALTEAVSIGRALDVQVADHLGPGFEQAEVSGWNRLDGSVACDRFGVEEVHWSFLSKPRDRSSW